MADEDGEITSEDLLQRQKRERKELQAKIQALKRSVPKGDKRKKKEIAAEIALLEAKLEEKHDNENKSAQNCEEVDDDAGTEILPQLNILDINQSEQKKVTRAQKRRDKKSAKEKERQKRIEEAEAENVHSARNVEQEKLKSLLTPMGLAIKEIAPDGHCLYNAIADQLQRLNIQQHTYQSLRELAARYMRGHQDDFLPFLIDQQTGDCYSPEAFSKYCQELSDTAVWGGQLEIQAISSALQIPVKIYQAVGPTIEIGQQYDNQEILLSNNIQMELQEALHEVESGSTFRKDCRNAATHFLATALPV